MRLLAGSITDVPRYAAAEESERSPGGKRDDTLERLVGPVPAQGASFVGREKDVAELNGAMVQCLRGRGSLVLIAGEPGIGKSRLMGEFATLAQRAGVVALWANCWEGGEAPVFWPWIQVLRGYFRGRDRAELIAELGPAAAELERLLPELGTSVHSRGAQADTSHEARFRLFDALAGCLRRASQSRPLLIAIDNLHAADESSLQLLRFLSVDLHDCRVLLLGSYREGEVGSDSPLWRLLGELGGAATRVQLSGLAPDEVAQLMRDFGGAEPEAELAQALHARTRGNPFFVREVLRLLGTGPAALDGVPDSVRQVIEHRLSRQEPQVLELLRSASLLGAEFSPALLAEISGLPLEALYTELAPALASRLLERDVKRELYSFAHALVREVCYAQLNDTRRRELHRLTARAIEQRDRDRSRPRAAEAAFHYLRAGSLEDLQRALDSSEQAARSARRLGAHEDAVLHLERALELLSRLPEQDDARRCELLLELGAVQMASGSQRAAQDTHAHAAQLAQLIGKPELFARAALGFGLPFGAGGSDQREVELLSAALSQLPAGDSALRALLASRLSHALLFGVRHVERAQLAEEALAMARRLGDAATLASVLLERHQALWTGAPAEERLAVADEVVQLAEANGDRQLALQARALRLGDLLELGRLDRYRAESAHYARCVRDDGLVTSAWHVPMQQATLAMLAGRFVEAEQLGNEGLALGRRVQHQGVEVFHHSVQMTIRYLQGRFAELLPALRHGAEAYPTLLVFHAGLALAHSERGERLEASLVFERLAANDFKDVPRDFLWVFNLALLSLTAHCLGDAARAAQLYAWLSPYAAYNVRVTRIGISSIGSAQHYLGLLALTLGHHDQAVDHLEQAVAAHTRQGALAMLANSQLQLGRALAARGDAAGANVARERAAELAQSLSIRLVLTESEAPPPIAASETRDVILRREGQDWTLEHAGKRLRLRHAVGVGMLARLLAEPEREISALELRGEGVSSDAGEILDARAKQEYRERVAGLREELARAERDNDLGGAERAREELEQIEAALRGAFGLGGRERRAGASSERARISVTKAIRAALRRVSELDAELGGHLERSVKTGHVCVYQPDPTAALRWVVVSA
ncbi:MAG TPA: AAA family ATPase [Polyangiales bacterium]|nr:AAA family ATPase [Polyangiales bacterium]